MDSTTIVTIAGLLVFFLYVLPKIRAAGKAAAEGGKNGHKVLGENFPFPGVPAGGDFESSEEAYESHEYIDSVSSFEASKPSMLDTPATVDVYASRGRGAEFVFDTSETSEGVAMTDSTTTSATQGLNNESVFKVDLRQAVIYSEILKPKYDSL